MSESYDDSVGSAYIMGMLHARDGIDSANPYYENTRQHAAYASGYRDEKVWMANNGQTT